MARFSYVLAVVFIVATAAVAAEVRPIEFQSYLPGGSDVMRASRSSIAVGLLAAVSLLGLLAVAGRRRATLSRLLHEERQLNQRLRDSSISGIATVDEAFRISSWNPAMELLAGVSRSAAIGLPLMSCRAFNDPRHLHGVRLALSGIEHAVDIDFSADTGVVPVRAYYSPLRGSSGVISGAMAIVNPLPAADQDDIESSEARLTESAA